MRQDRNLLNGRFKQTGKHSLTSKIFAFLLCAGLLFGMSPMSVLADTIDDLSSGATLDELASTDDMNTNYGTITTNNGTVYNNGTADDRQGTVATNNGKIRLNYGTVTTNNEFISTNDGTVTMNMNQIIVNYGIVTNGDAGEVSSNEADGSVTGGSIETMNGGTATDCDINYMHGGTATDCKIMMNMHGGTATDCKIGSMKGGTATDCDIMIMEGGTATDCTISEMTGGTARGANTKIIEYAGGNIENTISLDNIENYASGFSKDTIVWVTPLPTGGGSTPSGGAAVSTPEPVIPESPYRVFLFDTVPQVKNAAQGATVELKMDGWNTLPLWFMKEIAARGDLTIHLTYIYERKTYDVTFPAGMTLMIDEKIPYYGPLKLADMAIRSGGICNITQ